MTSLDPLSERVRICAERICQSGAPALAGLFDLTAQRLVRFATTVTQNQHDAEDAVQVALVRVAARPEHLATANQPWHYLLRIVRNESLAIIRKRKRWSRIGDISDLLTRRYVDQLVQEDNHRAVWKALRALPREQSEVVVLKIWEGMTFAEIGAVLELSPSTAASRYRYAIEKLEQRLRGANVEAVS